MNIKWTGILMANVILFSAFAIIPAISTPSDGAEIPVYFYTSGDTIPIGQEFTVNVTNATFTVAGPPPVTPTPTPAVTPTPTPTPLPFQPIRMAMVIVIVAVVIIVSLAFVPRIQRRKRKY